MHRANEELRMKVAGFLQEMTGHAPTATDDAVRGYLDQQAELADLKREICRRKRCSARSKRSRTASSTLLGCGYYPKVFYAKLPTLPNFPPSLD